MTEPHPATGTPEGGVPVVDLTETVREVRRRAAAMRDAERKASRVAAECRFAADHLTELADTLEGR